MGADGFITVTLITVRPDGDHLLADSARRRECCNRMSSLKRPPTVGAYRSASSVRSTWLSRRVSTNEILQQLLSPRFFLRSFPYRWYALVTIGDFPPLSNFRQCVCDERRRRRPAAVPRRWVMIPLETERFPKSN